MKNKKKMNEIEKNIEINKIKKAPLKRQIKYIDL